jgi:hypothetical protein
VDRRSIVRPKKTGGPARLELTDKRGARNNAIDIARLTPDAKDA